MVCADVKADASERGLGGATIFGFAAICQANFDLLVPGDEHEIVRSNRAGSANSVGHCDAGHDFAAGGCAQTRGGIAAASLTILVLGRNAVGLGSAQNCLTGNVMAFF